MPAAAAELVLPHDVAALTSAADRLLEGRWSVLGRERTGSFLRVGQKVAPVAAPSRTAQPA